MKKLHFFAVLLMATISLQAQMSKSEVESMIKNVNFQEIKDVYLIRTRQHDGAQGWYEKFEEFDPKTCKWDFLDKCFKVEGSAYSVMIPYDKIKLIFYKKMNYLTIELVD